jgi:hypothetical protein
MSPAAVRRCAGLLVVGLVLTSLPARVWLFGACPICGGIHEPLLLACVGGHPADPTPDSDPSDDDGQPAGTHHATADCCPPLPYGPTAPPANVAAAAAVVGDLRPESDPLTAPVPPRSLIRPPRAVGNSNS